MRNGRERFISAEEVDLIDLIQGLWQRRALVFGVALAVLLLSAVYAFLATPVYRAKVLVQPPSQTDIVNLNYGRGGDSGLDVLTVKGVYEVYVRSLLSESLRREFFRKVYLKAQNVDAATTAQDDLYSEFGTVLEVIQAAKGSYSQYAVVVNADDPKVATNWASMFADMAAARAKKEILKNAKSDAAVKADNLEQQIKLAQESAHKQREDQVAALREALSVAQSVGQELPLVMSGNAAPMEGPLAYMRGTKALSAEIEALENRVSDDPFIDSLRVTQAALVFYRSLEIDPSVVTVYRQDGGIEIPDKPVAPRKGLILLSGLVVGLLFGAILGMISHVMASKRAERADEGGRISHR